MAFTIPTYDTLKTAVKSVIKSLISDAATGDGSDLDVSASTLAHIGHGLHLHIRTALDNLIPTRADADWAVDAWCWMFGLTDGSGSYGRLKARGSEAEDALTVTATGATADLQGETLTDEAGLSYQINESYAFGGAGSANLDLAAVSTGSATNLKADDSPTLTWDSVPANVNATVTLVADLENGIDQETNSKARARLAELLQSPPQSGNAAQWQKWIEDTIPGVLDGWVYTARYGYPMGWGTVDYVATVRGAYRGDRDTSSAQQSDIEDYIEDNAPVLLMRNSQQCTLGTEAKDIECTIELAPGADDSKACDWDAESIKATVTSHDVPPAGYDITASVNVCSPTITDGIAVGDRVIIYDPDEGPAEGTVTAVNVGADAKVFTVANWPWQKVANALDGLYIQSGGGVIMDCIEAIDDYVAGLGPERGESAASPKLWDDTIRVKHVQKAALNADDSILDVVVDDIGGGGSVDCEPTESITLTVYLLIPDEIKVWEDKS